MMISRTNRNISEQNMTMLSLRLLLLDLILKVRVIGSS